MCPARELLSWVAFELSIFNVGLSTDNGLLMASFHIEHFGCRATLALVEKLPLTYLHVFSFSKRPGTKAAAMSHDLPPAVIKRCARELRALGTEKSAAFRATQPGRTLRVLTLNRSGESPAGAWTEAPSSNYLEVRVAGSWPPNQMLDVLISAADDAHLLGRPIGSLGEMKNKTQRAQRFAETTEDAAMIPNSLRSSVPLC